MMVKPLGYDGATQSAARDLSFRAGGISSYVNAVTKPISRAGRAARRLLQQTLASCSCHGNRNVVFTRFIKKPSPIYSQPVKRMEVEVARDQLHKSTQWTEKVHVDDVSSPVSTSNNKLEVGTLLKVLNDLDDEVKEINSNQPKTLLPEIGAPVVAKPPIGPRPKSEQTHGWCERKYNLTCASRRSNRNFKDSRSLNQPMPLSLTLRQNDVRYSDVKCYGTSKVFERECVDVMADGAVLPRLSPGVAHAVGEWSWPSQKAVRVGASRWGGEGWLASSKVMRVDCELVRPPTPTMQMFGSAIDWSRSNSPASPSLSDIAEEHHACEPGEEEGEWTSPWTCQPTPRFTRSLQERSRPLAAHPRRRRTLPFSLTSVGLPPPQERIHQNVCNMRWKEQLDRDLSKLSLS